VRAWRARNASASDLKGEKWNQSAVDCQKDPSDSLEARRRVGEGDLQKVSNEEALTDMEELHAVGIRDDPNSCVGGKTGCDSTVLHTTCCNGFCLSKLREM
jgi:hypothetical protein